MMCLLACAGVVPGEALLFTPGGPQRVPVGETDRVHIAQTIRHQGEGRGPAGRFYRNRIGMFFANYAIEQSLEDVFKSNVIDQFLNTLDEDVRRSLGNEMIKAAIRLSVEPVQPVYEGYRRQGLVPKGTSDLAYRLKNFFTRERYEDYHVAILGKFDPDHKLVKESAHLHRFHLKAS